jgi:hypothetical protein
VEKKMEIGKVAGQKTLCATEKFKPNGTHWKQNAGIPHISLKRWGS